MIKQKQILLLLTSLILILIPNILLIVVGNDTVIASNLKKIVFFAFSISIVIIPLFILRPKWFVLLNIFLTPILIFEIFNINHFKAPSSQETIASIFLTNYSEASEFISSYLNFALLFLFLLIVQIYIFTQLKRNFKFNHKIKTVIFLFSFSILTIIFIRDYYVANKMLKNQSSFSLTLNTTSYFYNVKLKKVFPLDIFIKLYDVKKGFEKLNGYSNKIKDFKFDAYRDEPNNKSEIYVLVIGETARKHNFKIYGYERNTTPNLDTISNITTFKNVKSSGNVTSISIPHILTRASPNSDSIKYIEPAIINAFKEAGFRNYWLSNQSIGIGSVFGLYSNLVDEYNNIAISLDVSVHDENLIPIFNEIISDKKHLKKFIIIHTIGSHFRYNLRYPKKFDIFKPSLEKGISIGTINLSLKEKLINSYDNSILYTDFIISQFISKLRNQNAISYLYYISDHGENLYDDQNDYLLHGNLSPTKYEMDIPLIVWKSDNYLNLYPEKNKVLEQNRTRRISTTNTFHTLLDLAGIRYSEEKLNQSFANKKFDTLQNRFLLKIDNTFIKID